MNRQRIFVSFVFLMVPATMLAQELSTTAVPAVVAVAPEYPAIAHQASIEGLVTVRVRVDAQGKVSSASLVAGSRLLSEAALMAARLWEFKPGTTDSRESELAFVYSLVPENACFQRTLTRFVPPGRVEVRTRKVVPTCSDCGPAKPIHFETCE